MSEEIRRSEGPDIERSLPATWKRLAPLSVGAVATSAAVIVSSAVLRRLLGGPGRILSWVGGGALLSVGAWLLARSAEKETEEQDVENGVPSGERRVPGRAPVAEPDPAPKRERNGS